MANTVFEWLSEQYPSAKKETLKRMVLEGRVTINGKAVRHVNQVIGVSDALHVSARPQKQLSSIDPLQVIFEDEDVLVINKPAGLITASTPTEPRPTALAIVSAYLADRERRARVGLIHRLDAPVSGLLVFSKNPRAYESLKRQLFHHDVRRIYHAVTHGVPSPRQGTIESQLVEEPSGRVHPSTDRTRGSRAVTDYDVVRDNRIYALVRVSLRTGRKHQIRAHLSWKNWPIVGDDEYGPQPPKLEQILLVACELEFAHPRTGERAHFEIPIPPIMTNMVM